jgi:DNA invertase Pin-like site-specific DNA recombinase
MAKAYSYVRISTDAQLKGDGVRRQLDRSREYAAAHGLDLDENSPSDIGVSAYRGANVSNGNLGTFLAAVRDGKIERGSYLLVESLDRLSREQPLKSFALFSDLINSGIIVVTLIDERVYGLHQVSEADLFISMGMLSRAFDESRTKSDRISRRWERKRGNIANIKLTSNGPKWLKLSRDKTKFDIIKERADIVREIFEEAASGIGIYTIARRLNARSIPPFGKSRRSNGWHQSSVNKILNNRAVLGEFQPHQKINGVRTPVGEPIIDYFPAVVDENIFYSAQAGRSVRRAAGRGRKGNFVSNLFSGLARCAYCNGRMHFENKGSGPKGGTYFVCEASYRGLGCEKVRWRYDHFEASFLAFVQELELNSLLSSDEQANKRNTLLTRIEATKARLAALQLKRENTYLLTEQQNADVTFIGQKLRECQAEINAIESELKTLESELAVTNDVSRVYYESKEQMTELIARLRNNGDTDVYRQRSLIAARLKILIRELKLSPAGYKKVGEQIAKALEDGSVEPEFREEFQELLAFHSLPASRFPHFEVVFHDNRIRTVFPDPNDPLQFLNQVVGDHEALEGIDPSGKRTPVA